MPAFRVGRRETMHSINSTLFRVFTRKEKIPIVSSRALQPEQGDVRELQRMRDELRLAREKARLFDVVHRNRIM
jgi:hypothetical protein